MVAQPASGPALVHYPERALVHYPESVQADPQRVDVLRNPERGEELVTLQPLLSADQGQRWEVETLAYRDEEQAGVLAEIWVKPLD
jgi:hypothetical protein